MKVLLLIFLQTLPVWGSMLNSLAKTPAMGWNTWNKYGCTIDQDLIIDAAKTIVELGLDKLGYTYVNIDDCWQGSRSSSGEISANATRFPDGIPYVVDQIHSLGLKSGIYSDAGFYTCGGRPGSLGYETEDAKTYASWGIDYLKYDNCYNNGTSGTPEISHARYYTMAKALNATGRPILLSLCNWGEDGPWNWGPTTANSWRMSGDIYDNFDDPDDRCPCGDNQTDCWLPGYHCSVMNILNKAAPLGQKAGPGGWNDLDMLEVGNGGMTTEEYRTHFSMWAIAKSPLILGNDITNLSADDFAIISNKYIIDVNQDPLGSPATRIWKKDSESGGSTQLWVGSLVNSSYVVALLNATPNQTTIEASFTDIFKDEGAAYAANSFAAFDLWANASYLGTFSNSISATVPSHGVKVYKLIEATSNASSKKTKRHKRYSFEL